jgi:ATP-dependent DNA helicase RecG
MEEAPTSSAEPPVLDASAGSSELAGVGPVRSRALEARGLRTLRDLLFLLPRRVVEGPAVTGIARALEQAGRQVRVAGRIESARLTRLPRRRSLFTVKLADGSGALDVVFFNQPWLRERFAVGDELEVVGRMHGQGKAQLIAAQAGWGERRLPPVGTLTPRYPPLAGFSDGFLARLIQQALPSAATLADPLALGWLATHDLPSLARAVVGVHAPTSIARYERARARLALEALLTLQARLARSRDQRTGSARALAIDDQAWQRLLASFPFAFTAGQERAVRELASDLGRTRPMRRLLHGDVGCGKTAVALAAALGVAQAGGQVAFLAPTELLAEQHHAGLAAACAAAGARAALLTGSLRARERKAVLRELASGAISIVFGTHALFSADVDFARLDLALIDEQQRFGVGQRLALTQKGRDVHLLLLTATPIPRTLAHTLYGDLDVTTIADRPPGRGSVHTRWVRAAERAAMLRSVRL